MAGDWWAKPSASKRFAPADDARLGRQMILAVRVHAVHASEEKTPRRRRLAPALHASVVGAAPHPKRAHVGGAQPEAGEVEGGRAQVATLERPDLRPDLRPALRPALRIQDAAGRRRLTAAHRLRLAAATRRASPAREARRLVRVVAARDLPSRRPFEHHLSS